MSRLSFNLSWIICWNLKSNCLEQENLRLDKVYKIFSYILRKWIKNLQLKNWNLIDFNFFFYIYLILYKLFFTTILIFKTFQSVILPEIQSTQIGSREDSHLLARAPQTDQLLDYPYSRTWNRTHSRARRLFDWS